MADHAERQPRRFKDFSEMMAKVPHLVPMAKNRRNQLLRELYDLAVEKKRLELAGRDERNKIPGLRADRKRALKVIGLLNTALQAVRDARASNPGLLEECLKVTILGHANFTFVDVLGNLNGVIELLKSSVCLSGAEIHPHLRTGLEQRLAEEIGCPRFHRRARPVPNFAMTEKPTRGLETWLIRKAAHCIDKYRPSGTRPFRGRDMVIMRLFEAAFGQEDRNPASIQKLLRRRPKGSQYRPRQLHLPILFKRTFKDNPQFLKQRTGRSESDPRNGK